MVVFLFSLVIVISLSNEKQLALLLALVSRGKVRQANVPRFEAQYLSRGIVHNVSICVRAGLPKPRVVPDTERIKDTKTLVYASTPLDANTLLCAWARQQLLLVGICLEWS